MYPLQLNEQNYFLVLALYLNHRRGAPFQFRHPEHVIINIGHRFPVYGCNFIAFQDSPAIGWSPFTDTIDTQTVLLYSCHIGNNSQGYFQTGTPLLSLWAACRLESQRIGSCNYLRNDICTVI